MSECRICDRCRTPFSVLDDGWETYSGTRNITDERGQRRQVQYQADACTSCVAMSSPLGMDRMLEAPQDVKKAKR